MGLREEIAAECRMLAERRYAARTLNNTAIADLEALRDRKTLEPGTVVDRDPCPRCARMTTR